MIDLENRLNKLKMHTSLQIILFVFGIFFDQFSKLLITTVFPEPDPSENIVVIKGILEFTYIRNSGASFGILQGKMIMFYIITVFVLAVIIIAMIKIYISLKNYYLFCGNNPEVYKKKTNNGMIFTGYVLAALAAGAAGNFIDRVRLGYVVDFISLLILKTPSFSGGFHWESFPIFNIADILVTFSAVILFVYFIFFYKDDENLHIFGKK